MNLQTDFMRYVLLTVVIGLLLVISMWVLLPFFAAGVWATMIVVATWPWFIKLDRKLGNRRYLSVSIMTVGMLTFLVVPLWLSITTISKHSGQLVEFIRALAADGFPVAPTWLNSIPLVGQQLNDAWQTVAHSGLRSLLQEYVVPHLADTGRWFIGQVGGLGGVLIQFFLIVVLSAVMYAGGENAANQARQFGKRLGGEQGLNAIILSGNAIRGVAMGVGVTAIVQTTLGSVGLAIAGVPLAGLLTAVMLMLCIAQVGPSPVIVPAVIWLFWQGDQTGWAVFLAIWGGFTISIDNFIRPALIKRGADLPLLLILLGVLGGLMSFGLIGIFLGPVVLAVTYTLTLSWLHQKQSSQTQEDKEPQRISGKSQ